ncbi:ACT domain-containing protein [Lacticaseibacillus zhaodongensis]|uniref:ACT domain-containing protein n=1 Tax=Lacticaseibacillus zhaodongensis TaxID=2668065 RepID=UPI0012D31E2F|nr:ACT domain-containing protein [Lacticaseibacillus zhaodongensis]
MDKYYIVDKSILPEVVEKVIEARTLLENGEVHQVSEAVKRVGISRGTYYKYKDVVFRPSQEMDNRKAVISLMLHHERGILSEVLARVSKAEASILTINQNIPIHNWASVVFSLDISNMVETLDELNDGLRSLRGVSAVQLVSVE